MSRRTKLILLSILLLLLAIPIWHAGSNWAPADPLRFRLISRERLPALERESEGEDYRSERVEIEVQNTSTAPRFLQDVRVRWYSGEGDAPFKGYSYLVDSHYHEGPVIPPGGTWRGTALLILPESDAATGREKRDPGYVQLEYAHASTFRMRMYQWGRSLTYGYLTDLQKAWFLTHTCTWSTTTLEAFP